MNVKDIKKPKNKLNHFIERWEKQNNVHFTPDRSFYEKLEIGQRRFWQIAKNQAQPNLCELFRLAEFFGADPHELF